MSKRKNEVWYGRIEGAERYPDVKYWQSQPDEKKFEVAWQMVIDAYATKGVDITTTRLNKSVGGLRRISEK